jgi:WD40 repeat protein/tetratricopeptide (TPR) repeat protein
MASDAMDQVPEFSANVSQREVVAFIGLADIRAAHTELQKQWTTLETQAQSDKVVDFIARAKETGRVLEHENDRLVAQTMIDYWATTLYRVAQHNLGDIALDEFDRTLDSRDLPENLYPYGQRIDQYEDGIELASPRLIKACVSRLEEHNLIAVVGSVGSGKHALLRALIAELRIKSASVNSQHWRYYVVRPGLQPTAIDDAEWTRVAAGPKPTDSQLISMAVDSEQMFRDVGHGSEKPALLIVDRFEEIFSCCDRDAGEQFISSIVSLANQTAPPVFVVLSMDSDALAKVNQSPSLANDFRQRIVLVALNADELREFVVKPADRVGLKFDDDLVESIVADVVGDPAALGLLQFTLRKLWQSREGNRITWRAYHDLGSGSRLALAFVAEQTIERLGADEQRTAEQIFKRLVTPRAGGGIEPTAPTPVRDLMTADLPAQSVRVVIDAFCESGLLRVSDGPTFEKSNIHLVSQALAVHWPRLAIWIGEERDRRRRRLRLTDASKAWSDRLRDPALLWRGSFLGEAETYSDLSKTEAQFVKESRKAAIEMEQAELAAARYRVRMTTYLATALSAAVVCALVALFCSVRLAQLRGREHAALMKQRAANLAESSELADAALWNLHAAASDESELDAQIHSSLAQFPQLEAVWPKDSSLKDHVPTEAHYTPDGAHVVVSTRYRFEDHDGHSELLANKLGSVQVVNATKVPPVASLTPAIQKAGSITVKIPTDQFVTGVCVSPDGKIVTASSTCENLSRPTLSNICELQAWTASGTPIGKPIRTIGTVNRITLDPSGRYLAVAWSKAGRTGDWDLYELTDKGLLRARKDQLGPLPPVTWAEFSPKGDWLAIGTDVNTDGLSAVHLWKMAESGLLAESHRPIEHHRKVNHITFRELLDGSGLKLASAAGAPSDRAGEIGILILPGSSGKKSAAEAQIVVTPDPVTVAKFSPDGKLIVAATYAGSVSVYYDAHDDEHHKEPRRWLKSFRHGSSTVFDVDFSPDGRFIATGGRDRKARIWEVASGAPAAPPLNHEGSVVSVEFSGDGRRLLTRSIGCIRQWDLAKLNLPPMLLNVDGSLRIIAEADKCPKWVTVSDARHPDRGKVEVWTYDSREPKPIDLSKLEKGLKSDDVCCAALCPAGDYLVLVTRRNETNKCNLWRLQLSASGRDVVPKPLSLTIDKSSNVGAVAVGEGAKIAAVSVDGDNDQKSTLHICDLEKNQVQKTKDVPNGVILRVRFSPDTHYLLIGSNDDSAKLWHFDVQGAEPVNCVKHTADVVDVAFHPQFDYTGLIATASMDQLAKVTRVDTKNLNNEPETVHTLPHDSFVTHVAFDPANPSDLVTLSDSGRARVWRLSGDEEPALISVFDHGAGLKTAAFHNGRLITLGIYIPQVLDNLPITRGFAKPLLQVDFWEISSPSPWQNEDHELRKAKVELLSASTYVPGVKQHPTQLSSDEIRKHWEDVTAPPGQEPKWKVHSDIAEECEATEQWFAASWRLTEALKSTEGASRPKLLIRRANAWAELEVWSRAIEDAQEALGMNPNDVQALNLLALVALKAESVAEDSRRSEYRDLYRKSCRKLLKLTTADSSDVKDVNDVVWIVSLGNAIQESDDDDHAALERLVACLEKHETAELPQHRICNTLAAYYLRAEKYDAAIKCVEQSQRAYKTWNETWTSSRRADGRIWDSLILAIAQKKQANGDKTKVEKYLKILDELQSPNNAANEEKWATAFGVPTPTWRHRAAKDLLLAEAKK